jgi:hypothetical protein
MSKTKEELEAENKRLLEENNRLLRRENERLRDSGGGSSRAAPVRSENGGGYHCSKCGAGAYYDGRCGDGAILMCDCNKAEDDYYNGGGYNKGYADR